ncbi:MAG: class I SAM-dependent methyltransferase [Acidimicrobiales bacterium]
MTSIPPAEPHDTAASRWKRQLETWAIPQEILDRAPESPWGYSTSLFAKAATAALEQAAPTPSRQRALEALPDRGVVLDVGAGGGAAGLPLAPPAGLVVAVDESRTMLAAFANAATERQIEFELSEGRWPEVAPRAPAADVVVCHHVAYNVPDLAAFVQALAGHARRRVVVELTDTHPLSNLSPLWLSIHGIVRPTAPTADDARQVAEGAGYDVRMQHFGRPSGWSHDRLQERVAQARKHLCVGPEHDAEIADFFEKGDVPEAGTLVTLWWDVESDPFRSEG